MTILKQGDTDKIKEARDNNTIYFECHNCDALFTAKKHEVRTMHQDLAIYQPPAVYYDTYCPCCDSYVSTPLNQEKYQQVKQKIKEEIANQKLQEEYRENRC